MIATSCAVALVPAVVSAQVIPYAGYTNGCFGMSCVPPSTATFSNAILAGLTYENAGFGGNTLGGFAAIGNVANGVGGMELDNLGAFYLSSSSNAYAGSIFNLAVTFTLPGMVGANYGATLTGSVNANQGGVFIDFDNTPQTFAYVGATTTGTLTFWVNDVSIIAPTAGATAGIAMSGNLLLTEDSGTGGQITPEPATFALMLPGLLGVLGVVRRRRSTV